MCIFFGKRLLVDFHISTVSAEEMGYFLRWRIPICAMNVCTLAEFNIQCIFLHKDVMKKSKSCTGNH